MGTKITICEFPDEHNLKEAAWDGLVQHVREARPDIVVLPEMPFCEWIFTGTVVDHQAWQAAVIHHDAMMLRLRELACGHVMSSRPVSESGKRYNEAFLWSPAGHYRPIRRKWFLPDAPTARETLWFHQGDRDFTTVRAGPVDVGFILCSEVMVTENARQLGFLDATLIAHPRASGNGRRWRVATEMSAIASGCFIASANRRSHTQSLFSGGSWLVTPEGEILGETSAEQPFITLEVDLADAVSAKSRYPRDFLRMYLKDL
jgi:N-carbamoylputrescine amidase